MFLCYQCRERRIRCACFVGVNCAVPLILGVDDPLFPIDVKCSMVGARSVSNENRAHKFLLVLFWRRSRGEIDSWFRSKNFRVPSRLTVSKRAIQSNRLFQIRPSGFPIPREKISSDLFTWASNHVLYSDRVMSGLESPQTVSGPLMP